ncbi:uncharacterized protein PFL1_06109 [Pseudozyma flocculosa PF-1]|uniref:Uncharacterized protein n=1 Tax=Pseudozyma flocculosa PF-1 TaxID=1277687 RepID=A0A061H799_9BASI|nr:uncharacterized protein PFL1_06109 [Pseudozyma flocculosa PF-1]EPQ26461.1 hypothetical protein PFL1_06109 [Pseudozyma flocculosa PF-1]
MAKSGATLSERIAALQRKTSNPVPSRSGGLSPGSSHGSSSGRLSPGDSPSRMGSNGSSNAVRDRIAKFQGNDERPLVPRSSFGVGAPNPELLGGARRGYPGSASKGSGAWGEGVLRPQMTGGVWLGGGSGGGWGDPATAPMRPQLTGGAFLNSGGRIPSFGSSSGRMQRGASSDAMPGSGRDAFADLDPDIVLTGRNRPESEEAKPLESGLPSHQPVSPTAEGKDGLPQLPDPPATDIDPARARQAREGLPATDGSFPTIPEFPTTPSAVPETPRKSSNGQLGVAHGTPDTSIEIGVHGRSPEDVEKLRRKAKDLELEEKPLSADPEEPWVLQPSSLGPGGEVPKPLDPSEVAAASSSTPGGTSDTEPWVQGYGKPDAEADALAASSGPVIPADPRAPGDLPQRAQVERTSSGKVDPADPNAHKVMGAGLLVPHDEVAEAKAEQSGARASQDNGLAGIGASMISGSGSGSAASNENGASLASGPERLPNPPSADSKSTGNGNGIGNGAASTSVAAADSSASNLASPAFGSPTNERPSTPGTPQNGSITATNSAAATPTQSSFTASPTTSRLLSPAERARQAVAEARSKGSASGGNGTASSSSSSGKGSSQRLRRPPPGTVLSAADLDASDDDYEPGWASVISSSRS